MTSLSALLLALTGLLGGPDGDTATLRDGRVVEGRITAMSSVGIVLDGPLRSERLSWEDIASARSSAPRTLHLKNGDRLTGRIIAVRDGHLVVASDLLPEIHVPLASLAAGAEAVAPTVEEQLDEAVTEVLAETQDSELFSREESVLEPKEWSGKFALLGSFRAGNADTLDINVRTSAKRQWSSDRLSLKAGISYGESEGEKNTSNAFAEGKFDHFYNKRFYIFGNASALWDEIADIDLRAIVGVGAGLNVWRGEENGDKRFFDVEAGISAIYEKFSTNGDDGLDPALRVATNYNNLIGEAVVFGNTIEFIMPLTEVDGWILRSVTSVEVPLSDSWYLKNSLELDYQAAPPAGTKNLDLKALVGVEYQF